jgi:hypothetical protein
MDEPKTELHWFEDKAALERFCDCVTKAYGAVQSVTGMSGLATGDMKKAVLLDRLVARMMGYHQTITADRLAPELAADFDREFEAIWPLFKDTIDETVAEAEQVFEAIRNPPERTH